MGLPCYLAMTAAEYQCAAQVPDRMAWMACHFSPYGTGLSNCPESLPKGAMLILNDRTPIHGHDPAAILRQLAEARETLAADRVLLDLQRPGVPETEAVVRVLVRGLSCPVGVSSWYAAGLDCPVFLPPVPLDCPPRDHLAPWAGREIWLDMARQAEAVTVTTQGAAAASGEPGEGGQWDGSLFCHYQVAAEENALEFRLWRTREDLQALLEACRPLGAALGVGLYQDLGRGGQWGVASD